MPPWDFGRAIRTSTTHRICSLTYASSNGISSWVWPPPPNLGLHARSRAEIRHGAPLVTCMLGARGRTAYGRPQCAAIWGQIPGYLRATRSSEYGRRPTFEESDFARYPEEPPQ